MDSATRRLHMAMCEYLDDVRGRSHMPLELETVESLSKLADTIARGTIPTELSPGQKAVAEASQGIYEQVTLDDEPELSPGERAAQAASSI